MSGEVVCTSVVLLNETQVSVMGSLRADSIQSMSM